MSKISRRIAWLFGELPKLRAEDVIGADAETNLRAYYGRGTGESKQRRCFPLAVCWSFPFPCR